MVIRDWVSTVLDIGNEVIEAISVGTLIAIGLLQARAVRAAGFATAPTSALAPSGPGPSPFNFVDQLSLRSVEY
ncbi:hypothetical protein FRC11_013269, partial [Ceratobasidium sp. 423]